ncbi:MAG: GNAT family N-acetyltransferase [Thermoplasmata archaeon]|nr:GNAT family N-acetyltransferase [Thermoplasmata archaeon]
MSGDLTIRLMERSDIENIAEFMGSIYGIEYGKEYWEWKLYAHPWNSGTPLSTLAMDGDKVVSFYATIPMHFVSPDGIIEGNQILDLATDPAYRRRGIFRKEMELLTEEMKKRGHRWSVGFAMEKGLSIQGLLTMGYSHVGNLVQVAKVYDSSSFSKREGGVAKKAMRSAFSIKARGNYGDIPPGIILTDHMPRSIEALLSNAKRDRRLWVERSREWLEWRIKNPRGNYDLLLDTKEGSSGYLLYASSSQNGMVQGHILDCLATSEDSYLRLFKAVDHLAGLKKAAIVRSQGMRGSRFLAHLGTSGFAKQAAKTAFIIRDLGGSAKEIGEGSNWHVCLADTDHG